MDLTFLGTASCMPTITRGTSCTVLRHAGSSWVFDAGEATQLQVQRSDIVKPGKIDRIFVTHAHGDHTFGLFGLACLMGQNRAGPEGGPPPPPVEIYGPEGLRQLLRATLQLTHSRIAAPYRVHELMNVPLRQPESGAGALYTANRPRNHRGPGRRLTVKNVHYTPSANIALKRDESFGEVEGGRDIRAGADGVWDLIGGGAPVLPDEMPTTLVVRAAAMAHTVPCVGFVVEEPTRAGRLRIELVEPVVERNTEALRAAGVRDPKKVLRVLKAMAPGKAFKFPDGTVLTQEEAVEPERKGRKIVIAGDTADATTLAAAGGADADVLVHESTNAFIPGIDRDSTEADVEWATVSHGHSTPTMAGRLAQRLRARKLILTHFSPRYRGDATAWSVRIMDKIEQQVRRGGGGRGGGWGEGSQCVCNRSRACGGPGLKRWGAAGTHGLWAQRPRPSHRRVGFLFRRPADALRSHRTRPRIPGSWRD